MCLGTKLSNRFLARYKAKGKKTGYIRVWKRVFDERGCFESFVQERRYKIGLCRARNYAAYDDELIHAYRNPRYQQFNGEIDAVLIECLVAPEWVIAISKNCLTTKAIVMPAYPKRKITVREFRVAIKGKKIQKYRWE